jgi:formate dehydrogenase subunit delta
MSPDKLVYMANQIGTFFRSQGAGKAPEAIAEHIQKFWEPRMRSAIFAHLDAGGAGLDLLVREAIEKLRGGHLESEGAVLLPKRRCSGVSSAS